MKKYEYQGENSFSFHSSGVRLFPGTYLIECYGAQGGTGLKDGISTLPGGKGAYVSGILSINHYLTVYLFIGGKGEDAQFSPDRKMIIRGGWNGGGNGKIEEGDNDDSGAGGGATDVRLVNGEWNETDSLKSRIMVAAGGSGSVYDAYGAPGGDINGYIINKYNSNDFTKSTTNQTNGFSLGQGENGSQKSYGVSYSGGGSGYYGGLSRSPLSTEFAGYNGVSSSGSSYVSGYTECNSISKNGLKHTGSSIHYSGLYFNKPIIKNGFSKFPNIDDSDYIVGKEGNGAVKITLLTRFTCECNQKRAVISYIFLIILLNKQ